MSRYLKRYQQYYRRGLYKTVQPIVEVTDTHVSQITDTLSKHPYIDGWDMYLFGSKASDEVSRDIDILFTKEGELSYDDKVKVKELINETYRTCIEDLHIKADVFYVEDLEVFSEDMTESTTGDTFNTYTTTDFDFEIKDGELVRFLDYKLKGDNGFYLVEMKKRHQKSLDNNQTHRELKKLI